MDSLVESIAEQIGPKWKLLYSKLGLEGRGRYKIEASRHISEPQDAKCRNCARDTISAWRVSKRTEGLGERELMNELLCALSNVQGFGEVAYQLGKENGIHIERPIISTKEESKHSSYSPQMQAASRKEQHTPTPVDATDTTNATNTIDTTRDSPTQHTVSQHTRHAVPHPHKQKSPEVKTIQSPRSLRARRGMAFDHPRSHESSIESDHGSDVSDEDDGYPNSDICQQSHDELSSPHPPTQHQPSPPNTTNTESDTTIDLENTRHKYAILDAAQLIDNSCWDQISLQLEASHELLQTLSKERNVEERYYQIFKDWILRGKRESVAKFGILQQVLESCGQAEAAHAMLRIHEPVRDFYFIKSKLQPKYVLGIQEGMYMSGTRSAYIVVTEDRGPDAYHHQWYLENAGDGFVHIISRYNGLVLNVQSGIHQMGTYTYVETSCRGSHPLACQKWKIDQENGFIESQLNGQFLSIKCGAAKSTWKLGAYVIMDTKRFVATSQLWSFEPSCTLTENPTTPVPLHVVRRIRDEEEFDPFERHVHKYVPAINTTCTDHHLSKGGNRDEDEEVSVVTNRKVFEIGGKREEREETEGEDSDADDKGEQSQSGQNQDKWCILL